jgi:hypothetical protein
MQPDTVNQSNDNVLVSKTYQALGLFMTMRKSSLSTKAVWVKMGE